MEEEKYTILVVDDEEDILEFIGYNLRREGYRVLTAGNGLEALSVAEKEHPDLILLDVMMPEMDGIEVCEEIRKTRGIADTVVALITARAESYTQIAAFEAGADDFITKPVRPKVLMIRIKALLKRTEYALWSESYSGSIENQTGNVQIDSESHVVTVNGKQIDLPRKEFVMLSLLTSKPTRVFSRQEIFNQVWGPEVLVCERTIDVYIRKLREKIGQERIRTIKGVGYRFEPGG